MSAPITMTAGTSAEIPGAPGRKALVVCLESGDAAWGWDRTLNATTLRGIPLTIGVPIFFAEEESKAYSQPLGLWSNGGAVILTEEKF
jgi:hypothetical protein